jgi:predicted ribosomally synthesized peptide with nif11-like leader
MNESIQELLKQASENPGLREKLKQADSVDTIIAIAKDQGYSIDASDVINYQSQNDVTLSDADLEKVAGGAGCYADAQTKQTTMYATKNCYN